MYEQMIKLVKLLDACNIQAGLEYLNSRVPHRFTAIYKLDGDVFILQHFVDKLGEIAPQLLTKVPFDASFCQYSVGLGQFVSEDTINDQRLNGHPNQGTLGTYVGLPLTLMPFGLYGTFCHFDFDPNLRVTDEEFEYLQGAMRVLPKYLNRKPLPNVQSL